MVEHTFFDQHFDALLGATLAIGGGVVAWIATLHRRLSRIEINEHRIESIESSLKEALAEAEKDHAEIKQDQAKIRDAVQETREQQAAHGAKLDIMEKHIQDILKELRKSSKTQ